ncbi:hypothetical protein ACQP1K_14015 [Sphaerimonospora sp. CA-214678]|uniref:hypothetical protein n=1 Tax=Sphaerimonospora sp. CA-214678 TaxID=3240029 RepID=UPI003D8CEC3B
MAFFRPRVSREAEVRYHADLEIGKGYPALLEKARAAERRLHEVQAAGGSVAERRAAGRDLARALTEALRAAEAGQRSTLGIKAYDDRIARRKARATPEGALWTAEVSRLRTLREENKLSIPRVPRTYATVR